MGIGAPKDLTACRRFFAEPSHPRQRQYEALRAFFFEGRPSHEVARDFGYSAGSFRVLCHAFRRDLDPQFFTSPAPGPRTQPQKSKAHDLVIALRKQNHSVYEIAELLEERKMPLSPTAVRELLRAEGFAPLPRRLDEERPARLAPTVECVKTFFDEYMYLVCTLRNGLFCAFMASWFPDITLRTQAYTKSAVSE